MKCFHLSLSHASAKKRKPLLVVFNRHYSIFFAMYKHNKLVTYIQNKKKKQKRGLEIRGEGGEVVCFVIQLMSALA